jgi:dTMP kinase
MSRGCFLTLEGIEGAGKSTVAQLTCDWLTRAGHTVRLTREPGGTPLAERLRQIVLEKGNEPMSGVAETLVMFAARAQHVEGVIRPALARGEWVVCDRFTDATRAYQGSGRGIDPALIDALARAVHGNLIPDCTLLLDLPVATGMARARARSGHDSDRFEAETVSFFERVRSGYLALAGAEPQRFRIIDASQPLAQVERALTGILSQLHPVSSPA